MCYQSAPTIGRKMKFTALLLIGAAALANAGPVARDTCATICDVAQTKFNVEPGKTYVYGYEGETLTKIEGASEEVSGLHVKTTARIHAISPCEFQLELRGTELSHLTPNDPTAKTASPVGGAFKDALEANAVRFGMNNGRVERVCGGARDASWVLNIKRAIISALQNNMADLKTETTIRESDVVGTCDTVYKTMEDGSIIKTKNLLGCIDREYMNTMIQHSHYMVPSDVQGVPFLKSEHTCKQVVAEGKIAEVTCTESHIARAFSNGEAGAATTLKMKMTLKEAVVEKVAPKPVAFTVPITYDMTKTEREIKDAATFVKAAIAEICATSHAEDKSPERFAKLIKNVQALDSTTLTKLHQEIAHQTCTLGKKTFHDVLPLAGTTAAVSVMKDILLAGEIDGVEANMWKSALAFIPNPNAEMIAHVTPLLAKPDHKIYLSTAAMVRNFCAQRKDCAQVKEVQDFINVLEARIGTDCSGKEDVVLMSLKAIGNAGITMTGKTALITCIKNEKISMDLRIASLEAFRHMEIGSAKPALLEIYKNMELDPEIRIGTFVALMRDPCQMCIDAVQATMAKERVLQVGSFVMSYMENARRSDNPAKKEINAILKMFDETKIKRDWNLERMKYSRAYATSHFSTYLNAGVDAESHVVFSPAGFLPRQVKTDLTINLFGRSINLLEVGARMEGLENILEHYFGPKGPLAETGVGRTKRAAIDDAAIDQINEKVKSQSILKEAHGLMYLKMFGSELGYQSFDMESMRNAKDKLNVLGLLRSIAKNHEQEFTQNFQILDLTYTIPTVLGLPLKLDLNAHGTMHLKVGGKLDIVNLMHKPCNMDIDGHIKPSAAIEVKTEMGIDAFLTQTGIKMVANLHTSTSIEGKIMLKDAKIFKVHYAVPETEQEIVHGMTKFFVKHHETEREQRMITKDAISVSKCSGETLAAITGLEMCGEVRLPNAAMVKTAPYFPLTGPVNVRLVISKKDPKLTSYDFEASGTSADGADTLKLILDTPGSKINRELATIVTLNTVQKSLDINVRSPWKKVHAAASLVNQADLKKLMAKVVIDEQKEYSATATVALQKENDVMKIIPEFNVIMNGKNPLKAGGLITIQKNAKIVADLKIENLTEKPITLVGSLEQVIGERQLRVNHDLTFTSPLITLAGKGFVEKQRVKLIVRSENSFKFRDGKEHKMTIDTKLHSEKKRDVQIFNFFSNLALSDFPEHNMNLGIDFKRTSENTKFNIEASFKKDVNPIKFMNTLTHKLTSPMMVGLKSELALPSVTYATEHKLTQASPKEFQFYSLTTWPTREIKSEFTLVIDDTKDYRAELKGYLMAPIIPRIDIIIRPTVTKDNVELFGEIKYEKHTHSIVLGATKAANAMTAHCHVIVDADRYELNVKSRTMPGLVDIKAELKLKEKSLEIQFNAAMEKTAIKIKNIIVMPKNKFEFNLNGEMTGEAIKAHADAALNEKKVEANLDYFRKDLTLKLLANVNGLTHLKSKIGSVALKVHNDLTGKDLTTLVEAKADDKALVILALKGSLTPDTLIANAKITALTTTVAGDVTLTKKDGTYSAVFTAVLPKNTVGFEVRFGGNREGGLADVVINLDKTKEGNAFEYHLKWSTAAPKDRQQFVAELIMKQPAELFPVPVKFTTLFSRDTRGTYKADIAVDYGFKFQLKAIHKMLPVGIETNVEINTPIENYERMTAELVATLIGNNVNFKLGAVHKKNIIEIILTGMATETQQELDFSFKTPFKGLEMITATIKNKIAGLNIDASAELKWGINKKIAIVFVNKASDLANIAGKLTIVTPVEKYETTALEYGFITKGDTRNLLVKLTWANQIAEWTVVHTLKPDVKFGFILESLLKVATIEDIKMTIDFAYKPMRLFSLDMKGMFGQKAVNLIAKAEKTETKVDVSLIFMTPKNPEGISAKFLFNDPNGGKNLDATLTLTLEPKKVINLATYMKKEDWSQTAGKIEFTSFFTQKMGADFGWHITNGKNNIKANLVLEYVPGKKIAIELDLARMKTDVTFTLKATTPIDPLRLFRYHVKSTGDLNNLNTHVEGQINDMLVSTDLLAKIVAWDDFEVTLTTITPIRNYEKTSLTVSNKREGNKLSASGMLLLKGNTWAVELITQAVPQQSGPPNIECFLTVTTPIRNYEKTSLTVTRKIEGNKLTASASLLLTGNPEKKPWAVELTYVYAPQHVQCLLTVTTPIKNYEKTSLTVSLSAEETKTTFTASLLLKGNTWATELILQTPAPQHAEYLLTVTTPVTNWEKTVLSLSVNLTPKMTSLTKASLTLHGKVWAIEVTTRFVDLKDMLLNIGVTTPLKNLEKITVELSHKGALQDMVSKILVATPALGEEIELSAKIVKLTNMEAKLSIKGAMISAPITVSISNRGETLKPLITIASVTLGPEVYTLTSTLNFDRVTNMEGSLVLTTPIEKYERVGLTWANKIAQGKREAKLVIEFQTEHLVTIDGSILTKGDTIETRFTVTTPFAAFDKAYFALDFTGALNNFVGTVTIELPKVRKTEVHFSNKLDLTNGISHKGTFRIDCIFFSTTAIDTSFELKDNTLKFEAKFGYGLKKGTYALNAKVTKANTITFELDTALNTDWTEAKSAALKLAIFIENMHLKISTELKLNKASLFSISFEHMPVANGFKCIMTLRQTLLPMIQVLDITADIELTLPKSLIKLDVVVDKAPFASLEFAHTYAPETLTTKLLLKQKILPMIPEILDITTAIELSLPKSLIKLVVVVDKAPFASLEFAHTYAPETLTTKLLLKQKILPMIPEILDITTDIEISLPKSLIKLVAVVDKAPFASLEFAHTYVLEALTTKLVATYKNVKAESNILISKPKALIQVDAMKNDVKIVEFVAAYEVTAEKFHAIKIKAIYEGKPLIDITFKLKPDVKDATVEVQESGRIVFGLRGNLDISRAGHELEAHIRWFDAPLVDLKSEFKPFPLTFAIGLKYKGEILLNTRLVCHFTENSLEVHTEWNNAPLIDLKTEFKAKPLTFAVELKYQGKLIMVTNNVLDLKAKTLKALLNIDPILEMFIVQTESWIIAVDGNIAQRRDITTLTLDVKKADKLIHFEVSFKTTGKIDLTLRPAMLTIDIKTLTKNFAKDMEAAIVIDFKKNAELVKTTLVTVINKVEYLKALVECKMANTELTLTTDLFFLPLNINSALTIKLDRTDALTFEIVCIADKTKAKDTTVTISGMTAMKPTAFLFNLKAILPTRTIVFTIKHVLANRNVEHMVSFSWEAGKTTGYSFTLADRSKQGSKIYNLVGEFTHPIRTVKYTAKAEISSTRCLFALDVLPDATLPDRKTFFKVDISNDSHGEMLNLKADTTFGHPSLEKPLVLAVTLTLNRGKIVMASSINLDYSKFERKRISASFRIVKESDFHYTLVSEVKQPATFVDVRVAAEIERTAAKIITLMTKVSYFTSNRQTKTITWAIQADMPGKKAEIRLTTPTADRKLIVTLMDKLTIEGRHARFVLLHEDVTAKVLTPLINVELDEASRAFKIEVGDLLKVDAGLFDKYMARLSIVAKERKVLLFKTNFKDATHMLINTRLEWDPVLLETIKREIPPIVAKVSAVAASTWEPITKDILMDIEAKIAAFEEVGLKDLRPIFEAWRKFIRALDKDLTTAIKGLKQMWRQNEFYLKDASNLISASWDKFLMTYKDVEAKFLIRHKEFMAHLEKNHKELMMRLRDVESVVKTYLGWFHEEFTRIRVQVETGFKEIKPRVEAVVRENLEWAEKEIKEFIRVYEPKVKATVATIMKTIGHIRNDIIIPFVTKMNERMTKLRAEWEEKWAPLRVKLEALWVQFLAKMEEIKATGLAKTLTELQATLEAKYATTSATIVEWLKEVNAKFEAAIKEWEAYPQVVELKQCIDAFKAKLVWAWEYIDIPGELVKLMDRMKMKRERFWRIIKDNKSGIVIFDKAAGILEFDIEIPIALKELAQLPKIDDLLSRLDVARREIIANLPKVNWTFMDYYYYWMPKSNNILDLLPPFTATGLVAGNQHFFTFDGSFYEFAGDCSYVLARDFVEGRFTVIANYRRTRAGPKRNSLTVMAGDKTIEIFNSFKTVVDKDVTELPIELPEAVVKRVGVDQIAIESKKGMTVSCHMKTEICTVAIRGWYFSKTGGLLGTYDYEPTTDLTNPMGKRLEDVEKFANTWEVAKTCSDKTNHAKAFHKVANIKSTVAYATCADLFLNDASPLRPAFRNVDVTPFMNVCVNDVFEFQGFPDDAMLKKTCTAVAAYMEETRLRGIMLKAPAHCMSCEKTTGQDMRIGETEKINRVIDGVDTVVVFEENICNKNRRKDLLGLVSSVQKAYKAEGLKNNLFGLAAFGGEGVHNAPHFHTIDGELMNTDRKFVRGVRSLEFTDNTPLNFVEGAIAFAAKNYPWRAGVKRNIIVVTCSACMDRIPPHTDLSAVLTETKVNVHMLRDLELTFRGGKRAANVLGFDRTGVFTTKDTSTKTLAGDAALLAQLAVPKETCIPALMEGEGSFFTINSFTNGRIRDQKKLIDVVSRRVAATSVPATCQICECKVTCPFTMKTSNVCKPCKN